MDIEAKFEGVERKEKLISRKNILTGEKEDDKEISYTVKFAMKKIKLGRDENVKEGTSDPWMRIAISSFDEATFAEFDGMKMGDIVIISVDRVNSNAN